MRCCSAEPLGVRCAPLHACAQEAVASIRASSLLGTLVRSDMAGFVLAAHPDLPGKRFVAGALRMEHCRGGDAHCLTQAIADGQRQRLSEDQCHAVVRDVLDAAAGLGQQRLVHA